LSRAKACQSTHILPQKKIFCRKETPNSVGELKG
jgi:hypothetical protein